jgi:catechol 2,3-dioxygenase-like lactoylglutathione lyase family enzyme
MKASHVHIGVTDLAAALEWLETVWQLRPTFRNERMAVLPFGDVSLIVDASTTNTVATVAFESANCDDDVGGVRQRGGVILEQPADRPWGVRAARVRGPGALTFEIEQTSSASG